MATHPKPSLHTSPNKLLKTLDAKPYPPPQSPSSFVSRGKSRINDGTTSVPIKKEFKNEQADFSWIYLSEYVTGGASRGCVDRTSIPIKNEVKNEPAVFSEYDNGGASPGCIGRTSIPIMKEIKNEPVDSSGICFRESDNGGFSGGCIDRTSILIKKEVKNEPMDSSGFCFPESENGGVSGRCIDRTSIPIKKEVKNEPVDSTGICSRESENGGVSGVCIGRTSIPIERVVRSEPESDNGGVSRGCVDRTAFRMKKEDKNESESDNSRVSRGCTDRTSIPIKKELKNEPESDNGGVSPGRVDRASSIPIKKEVKNEPESDNRGVGRGCIDLIKQEVKNEAADCCGICLSQSENGRVSRGYIDSCNHYFCFICIREWSKVESKCPLCKRRFSTIRRPPKPPIFTTERVIHVRLRDQIHHYSGNQTNGPPDPYGEVTCSVCHGVADENLLLLCDICDVASHTYCVGLGSTVPEGDWVCQDCTLLRDEHLESETGTDSNNNIDSDNDTDSGSDTDISLGTVHRLSSANEHVSVFDIVQEPSTPVTRNRPVTTSLGIVTQNRTHPNARTLQHCRNLNDRIRILRENWNGFRNGILQFSSPCGNISCQKSPTRKTRRYSVSCLNHQSEAQCSSSDKTNDVGSHDIHKAWKMMDKAKSVKRGRERFRTVRQSSESHLRKLNATESAKHINYRHISPESQQMGSKNVGSIGQGSYHYHSLTRDSYKQAYSVCGEQKWRRYITEDVRNCYEGSVTGHSPISEGLRSSKAVPTEKSLKRPACLSSSVVSAPIVLNKNHVKGSSHTSSSHSKLQHSKETIELERICVDRQQYNDAKTEIRSLVKLRLQTKEEKLGVDAFKEVARLATHSILAACGLEHPKPGFCSVPGFICSHTKKVGLFQISSSLMPNSCRECFDVFVKEMVNIVMLQKKRMQRKT